MTGLPQQIMQAFSVTPLPTPAELVRGSRDDLERAEILAAFNGKPWPSFSEDHLRYHSEALFYFTAPAWLYFIPAYMNAVLRDFNRADTIPGMIIGSLRAHAHEFGALANREQRDAIVAFVRWLAVEHADDLPSETAECAEAFDEGFQSAH